jgi:hypothetical protein
MTINIERRTTKVCPTIFSLRSNCWKTFFAEADKLIQESKK